MKKITIEITELGWTTKVQVDGHEATQIGKITERGSTEDTDFDDIEWISDSLADSLNSFYCHDVATSLSEGRRRRVL